MVHTVVVCRLPPMGKFIAFSFLYIFSVYVHATQYPRVQKRSPHFPQFTPTYPCFIRPDNSTSIQYGNPSQHRRRWWQLRRSVNIQPTHSLKLTPAHLGVNTAAQLATAFHDRFRIIMIEKNSHFQHLFAFPRFAVASGVDTHKAFIPYVPGAFAGCPPGSGTVVQAQVVGLTGAAVQLDRDVLLNEQIMSSIPYSYLVRPTRPPRILIPSNIPRSSQRVPNTPHHPHSPFPQRQTT